MLLSTTAERMYWTARYLERIENTARLISVYHKLLLDLPGGVDITWYNLIVLNSGEDAFASRYKKRDERNVLKFMLVDEQNGSTLSDVKILRENIRTSRDVLASEVWECVNELYTYAITISKGCCGVSAMSLSMALSKVVSRLMGCCTTPRATTMSGNSFS